MTQGNELKFDPKSVVANSGVPRKKVTWASAFVQTFLKAPMERAIAASLKIKAGVSFTADQRRNFAVSFRMHALYGQYWWRSSTHESRSQGAREVSRRRRQILNGLHSPVYSAISPFENLKGKA